MAEQRRQYVYGMAKAMVEILRHTNEKHQGISDDLTY